MMTELVQQKQVPLLLLATLILFLVTSLTAVTIFFKKSDIENDLTQRTNRLLTLSGLFRGTVVFDGRDAVVKGDVTLEENKKKIQEIVNNVEGVRVVNDQLTISIPNTLAAKEGINRSKSQKPTELKGRFTLRYDSRQWVLVGTVESEVSKENLLNSTQEVIGEQIVNRLTVDPNKSRPEWIDKYLHVLENFTNVHGGAELTLDKGTLIIGGEVDSKAAMRMTLLPFRDTFGEVVNIRNALRIPKFEGGLYLPQRLHLIEQVDISNIKFNKDNTEIQSTSGLDQVISLLQDNTELYIEIAGHSNLSDNEDENIQLGLDRAMLIKQHLVQHGIKQSRIRTNSYGSSRPIVDSEAGHTQRIEVTVIREG